MAAFQPPELWQYPPPHLQQCHQSPQVEQKPQPHQLHRDGNSPQVEQKPQPHQLHRDGNSPQLEQKPQPHQLHRDGNSPQVEQKPQPHQLHRDGNSPQVEQKPQPQVDQQPQQLHRDEQSLYKKRLYEYTQRIGLDPPVYRIENKASQHASQFKCFVVVEGETYESLQTFSRKKDAELDACRCALEGILGKRMEIGYSTISKNIVFCKAILNEFAAKLRVERPKYNTVQAQSTPSCVFVSSLEFRGVFYPGRPAKSKREAESIAAHDVIMSILGNSKADTLLLEILKSKAKLFAAPKQSNEPNCAYGVEEKSNSGAVDGDCTGKEVLSGSGVLMQTSNEKQFKDAGKACDLQTEGLPVPSTSQNPATPPVQSFAKEGCKIISAFQADKSVPQTPVAAPVFVPSMQDRLVACDSQYSKITSASQADNSVCQTPRFPVAFVPSMQDSSVACASQSSKITSASRAKVCVSQTPGVLSVIVPSMQDCSAACSSQSSKKRNRRYRWKANKKARAAMQMGVTSCSGFIGNVS